jgi:drug/metabolite transporter (DMT)-like permease
VRPLGSDRQVDVATSVGLVVMWSSGFIGAELGTRTAPAATLLAWRFLALTLMLLVVCAALHIRPTPAALGRQAVLALLCQVVYLGLVFTGVRHGVPAGVAALIAALQPMLVATAAGPLLGERTDTAQRIGLVLGLAGVVLVVGGSLSTGESPALAFLLPVAGMLSLSSGTVVERRWRPSESVLEAIAIQAAVCTVSFFVVAFLTGEATPPADPQFWAAVTWLVVLSSCGGYGLYILVSRRQGATRVSTLLYLTPPTTMLWAFVMFGDEIRLLGLVGLVVSAVGVLLVLRRRSGPSEPAGSPPPPADRTWRAGDRPR